jgi:hypothetical protein
MTFTSGLFFCLAFVVSYGIFRHFERDHRRAQEA